jgi:hypothetical protein
MIKFATITDLQRKSKEIQDWVAQGFEVRIKKDGEVIMVINLPSKLKNKKKKNDWFEDMPKYPFYESGIPKNINTKEIYEIYGAKQE